MPTEKPKIIVVIEDELLERIDDYRYGHRIPNRSDAIRHLIREGLEKYNIEPPPAPAPEKPRKRMKK